MIFPLENPHFARKLLPFIGGALYAMGFPHTTLPQVFFLSIIGIIILFSSFHLPYLKAQQIPLKSELLSLLFFSFGYCLTGYYWIPYTLETFGSIPFPLNYILGLLFSLIIVPQFLAFLLIHRLIQRLKFQSSAIVASLPLRHVLYATVFTILEYYIPQQFPAHLGHPWLSLYPYLGLAPIFGAPIFSFMSYWMALSILSFLRQRFLDKWMMVSLIIFLALNISFPLKKLPFENLSSTQVRMVQANIGNFLKLSSESGGKSARREVYDRYFGLSVKDLPPQTDLIIWPETAYPQLLDSSIMRQFPNTVPRLFQDTISSTNAELLVGGYDRSMQGKKSFKSEYNTAFLFSKQKNLKDYYHKMKLIPFGEGLPFGPFNHYFSGLIKNISYFAEGERYTLFKTEKNIPFITLICYEALFSNFIRNYLNNLNEPPHMLINITNDSWYGDTSEPYQHLFLAHWRALEFQIPILRMTNTGITSVLYPDGSESKRLGVEEKKYLDIKIETGRAIKTYFQKFGFSLTFLVSIILIALIMLSRKLFKTEKESPL